MKNLKVARFYIYPKSLRRRVNREILKTIAVEFGGRILFQESGLTSIKGISREYIGGVIVFEVDEGHRNVVKKLFKKFGIKVVSKNKAFGFYPRRIILQLLTFFEENTPIGFGRNMDRLVLIKLPNFIQTDSYEFSLYMSYLSSSVIWLGYRMPSDDFKLIDSISIGGIDEDRLFDLATFIAKHTIGLNRRLDILEQLKGGESLFEDEEITILPEEGKAMNMFFSKGIIVREGRQEIEGRFFLDISNYSPFTTNTLVLAANLTGFKTIIFEGKIYSDLTDFLSKDSTIIYLTDEDAFLDGFNLRIDLESRSLARRFGGYIIYESFSPIWEIFGDLI